MNYDGFELDIAMDFGSIMMYSPEEGKDADAKYSCGSVLSPSSASCLTIIIIPQRSPTYSWLRCRISGL